MDLYFRRQHLILWAGLLSSISTGFMLMLGDIAIITASVKQRVKDVSIEQNIENHGVYSLVATVCTVLAGSIILPFILQKGGRMPVHIISNVLLFFGWVIYLLPETMITLYVARGIQQLTIVGLFMNSIIISEYVPPERRGYFICLQRAFNAIGILWAQLVLILSTYQKLSIQGAVLTLVAIILTCFWPESPPYLALKIKDEECKKSFKWLHGDSSESQLLLKELLDSQKAKRKNVKKMNFLEAYFRKYFDKDYVKPFWIMAALILLAESSPGYNIVELGERTSTLYVSLAGGALTILALLLSAVLITQFNRRSLLLFSGLLTVAIIFLKCLLLYLKTLIVIPYEVWIMALVILLQCFVACLGVIPISFVLIGEIFPIEDRGYGTYTSGVFYTAIFVLYAKVNHLIRSSNEWSIVYGVHGAILFFCLLSVYCITPETKDKSLQAIEKEMKGARRSNDGQILEYNTRV